MAEHKLEAATHALQRRNTWRTVAVVAGVAAVAVAVAFLVKILLTTKRAVCWDPKHVGRDAMVLQARVVGSTSTPSIVGRCLRLRPSHGLATVEVVPCDAHDPLQQLSVSSIHGWSDGTRLFQLWAAEGAARHGATSGWHLLGACALAAYGAECGDAQPCPWTFTNGNAFDAFGGCGGTPSTTSCSMDATHAPTPDALFAFNTTADGHRLAFVLSDHNADQVAGRTHVQYDATTNSLQWGPTPDVELSFVNVGAGST